MADFTIYGQTTVRKLKEDFKKAFGSSLRVYMSVTCKGRMADDKATLASIRTKESTGGFSVGGNKKVGTFEKEFAQTFGIGVQVANAKDTELADDNDTLVGAGRK